MLICDSKYSADVRPRGCLSFCFGPSIDWRPVLGVPLPTFCSRDKVQLLDGWFRQSEHHESLRCCHIQLWVFVS